MDTGERRCAAPLRFKVEKQKDDVLVDVPDTKGIRILFTLISFDVDAERGELLDGLAIDRRWPGVVFLAGSAVRPGARGLSQFPLRAASPLVEAKYAL